MRTKYFLFAFFLLLFLSFAVSTLAVYVCPGSTLRFSNLSDCNNYCAPIPCFEEIITHYKVCQGNVCVTVPGAGTDECQINLECGGGAGGGPGGGGGNGGSGGNGGGGGTSVAIDNPLNWNTIEELIRAILVFLRNFALAVTPIVIILAGYYFVTSAGDPAKVTLAQNMILYALIGLGIILMSEAIIVLIKNVIGVRPSP